MSILEFGGRKQVARLGLVRFGKLLKELDFTLDNLYRAHEVLGAEEYFKSSDALKEIQEARQHIINAIKSIAASIDAENSAVEQDAREESNGGAK